MTDPTDRPTIASDAGGHITTHIPDVRTDWIGERIGVWLPSHTHHAHDFIGNHAWTWTTRTGTWTVTADIFSAIGFTGPVGKLGFGRATDRTLRQLRDILIALDAITGEGR